MVDMDDYGQFRGETMYSGSGRGGIEMLQHGPFIASRALGRCAGVGALRGIQGESQGFGPCSGGRGGVFACVPVVLHFNMT